MSEEEGNTVPFQVFCNFAPGTTLVGQAEHLWDVRGKQADAAKIILDPKTNTEIKCRRKHKMNTLNFCRASIWENLSFPRN